MSWAYVLLPPEGSHFSEQALTETRAYWAARATYVGPGGLIVLCESVAYRNEVVASGTQAENRDYSTQSIQVEPRRIVLYVCGNDALNIEFRDFLVWFLGRWPGRLVDEAWNEVTPDEFLRRQLSVNRNRN